MKNLVHILPCKLLTSIQTKTKIIHIYANTCCTGLSLIHYLVKEGVPLYQSACVLVQVIDSFKLVRGVESFVVHHKFVTSAKFSNWSQCEPQIETANTKHVDMNVTFKRLIVSSSRCFPSHRASEHVILRPKDLSVLDFTKKLPQPN